MDLARDKEGISKGFGHVTFREEVIIDGWNNRYLLFF